MNPAVRENRREQRRAVEGPVRVWFQNPQRLEIHGQLKDLSSAGFRMVHDYAPLSAGRARVMWNRISGAHVETGFLVLTPA